MNNCYKYNYKYNQFNNNCANYIYKLLYRYLHLISDKVSIWGSYCQFYCHLVHIDKFTHSKFFNVVYFSSPSVFPSIADDMFNYKRVDIMKIIIIFHYHYHHPAVTDFFIRVVYPEVYQFVASTEEPFYFRYQKYTLLNF